MNNQPHIYEFGPFRLDVEERILLRDGRPVLLRPKVFDILVLLVCNSGRLVTKDELIGAVWIDSFVEENNLNRCVSSLRKALGESPGENRYIQTVPKHGYRFIVPVNQLQQSGGASERVHTDASDAEFMKSVEQPPPALGPDTRPVPTVPSSVSRPGAARGRFVVFCVLTISALLIAFIWFTRGTKLTDEEQPARSIAVLPFRSLTAESSDGYLEVVLADALITRLRHHPRIETRQADVVMKYVGTNFNPLEIGRELNVQTVLHGNFQKMGGRIHITAQLLDVASGRVQWEETFNQPVVNASSINNAIVDRVVETLEHGSKARRVLRHDLQRAGAPKYGGFTNSQMPTPHYTFYFQKEGAEKMGARQTERLTT